MDKQICFFTGNMTSFNVRQTLVNIGKMLRKEFELHLVTSKPTKLPDGIEDYFKMYSPVRGGSHLDAIRALRQYFTDHSPDVVTQIGRVPVDGNIISFLKPENTKFVCRYSGDLFYEYNLDQGLQKVSSYLVKNVMGRLPMLRASSFVAMGPRQKMRLVARGVDPTDVEILPPPIDPERLQPGSIPDIGIPPERDIILYVGRVSERKGAKTLESIIPKVLEKRDDLHFVLVGTINYQFKLDNQYEDRVTLTGPIRPAEVPAYHEIADLYVHPSLTEGISRALLEAMLSNTPVITRDVGDQAYATTNYFTTDDDLVSMIVNYEELSSSDSEKFTVKNLRQKYTKFFQNV